MSENTDLEALFWPSRPESETSHEFTGVVAANGDPEIFLADLVFETARKGNILPPDKLQEHVMNAQLTVCHNGSAEGSIPFLIPHVGGQVASPVEVSIEPYRKLVKRPRKSFARRYRDSWLGRNEPSERTLRWALQESNEETGPVRTRDIVTTKKFPGTKWKGYDLTLGRFYTRHGTDITLNTTKSVEAPDGVGMLTVRARLQPGEVNTALKPDSVMYTTWRPGEGKKLQEFYLAYGPTQTGLWRPDTMGVMDRSLGPTFKRTYDGYGRVKETTVTFRGPEPEADFPLGASLSAATTVKRIAALVKPAECASVDLLPLLASQPIRQPLGR